MSTFQPAPKSLADAAMAVHHEAERIRTQREARRIVDAEEEPVVDFDSLFLDRDALEHLPQTPALIEGVLPRHAYAVLRGRDGSFKSFVALDWALSLATATMWQLNPVEAVPVLYIAGEGAFGLRQRVTAWEAEHNRKVQRGSFVVRSQALNLHTPGKAFEHLLEHVAAAAYGLVVVDTLRRVSGGADGNSSEMGAVVDNLDRIKQATAGGSVLVVAHTDKADNDSRGYSGIEDDADVVWHAKRDGSLVALELAKMKDGPDGRTVHLEARVAAESLALRLINPATAPSGTESEAAILATLRDVFPEGAHGTALLEASRVAKTTFYRSLNQLKARGAVRNDGTAQRPFWVAVPAFGDVEQSHPISQPVPQAGTPLTSGFPASPTLSPSHSHPSPTSPTPLEGGTTEPGTETSRLCDCGNPRRANLPHHPNCRPETRGGSA